MKLLLLVADSLRYDYFHANLPGAMVWDNAYACAPWTVASQASLLTGLSPSAAFHAGLADVVSEQPFTVADWLGGDIGYKCSASWLLSVGHFGRNFDVWHQSGDYRTDEEIVKETLDYLAAAPENAFHITWLNATHFPYKPNAETRERFGLDSDIWHVRDFIRRGELPIPKGTLANCFAVNIVAKTAQDGPEKAHPEVTMEEIEFLRRAYAACCWDMDRRLEEVYAAATTQGWGIIVTSDHGESLGERGGFGHWDLHEENVHIPLAASLPGLGAGVHPYFASHIDIPKTILELTLGEVTGMEGYSLLDLPFPRVVHYEQGVWGTRPWQFGRKDLDSALIYDPEKGTVERYDCRTDPEQRKAPDVFGEQTAPLEVVELIRRGREATFQRQGLSEEQVADALRKLGYI